MGFWSALLALNPSVLWKLDDDVTSTVATDATGNGRHGTYPAANVTRGHPSLIPAESGSTAARNTGNNNSWIARAAEAWMNVGAGSFTAMITLRRGSVGRDVMAKTESWQIWVDTANNRLACHLTPTWTSFYSPIGSIQPNTTYLVALRRDAATGRASIWIDGVKVTDIAHSGTLASNSQQLRVFGASIASGTTFGGDLAGAAYWVGAALTDTQLADLYDEWATVAAVPDVEVELAGTLAALDGTLAIEAEQAVPDVEVELAGTLAALDGTLTAQTQPAPPGQEWHVADFAALTPNSTNILGWTQIASVPWIVRDDPNAPGTHRIAREDGINGHHQLLTLDAIGAVRDVEVLADLQPLDYAVSATGGIGAGVCLRKTGHPRYLIAWVTDNELRLAFWQPYLMPLLASVPFPFTPGDRIIVRARAIGNQFMAKAWSAYADEPADWMVTATITTNHQTDVGPAGLFSFYQQWFNCYRFAAATHGATASFAVNADTPGPFTAPAEWEVATGDLPVAWGAVDDVAGYHLELSKDGGATWEPAATTPNASHVLGTGDIAWIAHAQLRVRSYVNVTTVSPWRYSEPFMVWQGAKGTGVFEMRFRGATSVWIASDDLPGLKRIQVQVDRADGNFTGVLLADLLSPLTAERRRRWVLGAKEDTIYQWRARVEYLDGTWGNWSSPRRFRTRHHSINVHGRQFVLHSAVNRVVGVYGNDTSGPGFWQLSTAGHVDLRVPISGAYGVNSPDEVYGVRLNRVSRYATEPWDQEPWGPRMMLRHTPTAMENADEKDPAIEGRASWGMIISFIPEDGGMMELCGGPGRWMLWLTGGSVILQYALPVSGATSGNPGGVTQILGSYEVGKLNVLYLGFVQHTAQVERLPLCGTRYYTGGPLAPWWNANSYRIAVINSVSSQALQRAHFSDVPEPPTLGGLLTDQFWTTGSLDGVPEVWLTRHEWNDLCFYTDPETGEERSTVAVRGIDHVPFTPTNRGWFDIGHGSTNFIGQIGGQSAPYGRYFQGIIAAPLALFYNRQLTPQQVQGVFNRTRGPIAGLREYMESLKPSHLVMFDDYAPPAAPTVAARPLG
jgi:hypothetical protein